VDEDVLAAEVVASTRRGRPVACQPFLEGLWQLGCRVMEQLLSRGRGGLQSCDPAG
jgi:hypothetical protein